MRRIQFLMLMMLCLTLTACGAVQSTVRRAVHHCPIKNPGLVVWSPNGKKLAYNVDNEAFVRDLASGDVTPLGTGFPYQWSPDSRRILTYVPGYSPSILVNADGSNPVNLPMINTGSDGAAWSPDGSQIAYIDQSTGQVHLGLYDLGSGTSKLIYPAPSDVPRLHAPVWSPDGTQLAFLSGHPEPWEPSNLIVVNVDGTDAVQLSTDLRLYVASWSPDGERLVLWSNEGDLYAINSDGTGLAQLNQENGQFPHWLPDGDIIAIQSKSSGQGEATVQVDQMIVRFGQDGTITELAPISYEGWVSFSPDGTQIAYVSDEKGLPDLFMMNVDGTDQIRLIRNPGHSTCFDWPF